MASYEKRGGRWRVFVCVDRKRASKTFDTKREATAWGNTQEEDGILARHTVKDALKRYLPIAETHKGAQSELSRLKSLSILDSHTLESLTPAILSKWRDARLKEVAPVSVRREMIILGRVFAVCRDEWGWMRNNPLEAIKKPPTSIPRRRGISQNEIDGITANLHKMRVGKQVAQMFHLSLETAMRLGELLSLTWDDVSEKSVVLSDTKNGDRRDVPLSLTARGIIEERRKIDPERVFTLNAHVVSKSFQRGAFNGVHFHDARSEAITRLSKKLDILDLARMVGHRDIKNLMIYYRMDAVAIADRLD